MTHVVIITILFLYEDGYFYSFRFQVLKLLSIISAVALIGFFFGLIVKRYKKQYLKYHIFRVNFTMQLLAVNKIFLMMIALIIIDFIYSRGFPIQMILGIPGPSSTSYGAPLIHGLQKALQLILFTNFALNERYKSYGFIILCIIPFLEFSRSTLIIYMIIYFARNAQLNTKFRVLNIRMVTLVLACATIFIVLGNTRNTDALNTLQSGASLTWIWFYTYLVASYCNLSEVILLDNNQLIYQALNARTGWFQFYTWGGIIGFFFGIMFVGFFSGIFHGNIRARLIPVKLYFTVGCALMFFGIFLTNNAFIFMFIFTFFLSRTSKEVGTYEKS